MTKVYNRKTKEIVEEKHFGEQKLNKIYHNKLLTLIATSKFLSNIYGLYNNTSLSKKKIKKFIEENQIDMKSYEKKEYHNFNEFFIRKKKEINFSKEGFISPCDGKCSVYKVEENQTIQIKNHLYTIEELIEDKIEKYKNGYLFVYRLTLDNCHRYYYIDNGKNIKQKRIKGKLHTVSSSSKEYKIYKENERIINILQTTHYGKIIWIEVGALLVGKIINHKKEFFKRGEEKGYFLPGGSTIIILANNIKVDDDILEQSKKNIETIVRIGEKVGE